MSAHVLALKEIMLIVVTVSFSVGYSPPKKLKAIMSTPEFETFVIFSVLFMALDNDVFRAACWSLMVYIVDRYFRDLEKNSTNH
jgi:hypothetical protein